MNSKFRQDQIEEIYNDFHQLKRGRETVYEPEDLNRLKKCIKGMISSIGTLAIGGALVYWHFTYNTKPPVLNSVPKKLLFLSAGFLGCSFYGEISSSNCMAKFFEYARKRDLQIKSEPVTKPPLETESSEYSPHSVSDAPVGFQDYERSYDRTDFGTDVGEGVHSESSEKKKYVTYEELRHAHNFPGEREYQKVTSNAERTTRPKTNIYGDVLE